MSGLTPLCLATPLPAVYDIPTIKGDIRIDPAPRWNRTSDTLLVPGLTENGTRQMFMLRLSKD